MHHTQKQLSWTLSRHSEMAWVVQQCHWWGWAWWVHEGMTVALDPGDLNRDGAPSSECQDRVRNGDRGEAVGGYPLMSVVGRDMQTGQTLPLYTNLLSSERPGDCSENHEILSTMDTVERYVAGCPLWVIDRGGDRGRLWTPWLQAGRAVLVRAAN